MTSPHIRSLICCILGVSSVASVVWLMTFLSLLHPHFYITCITISMFLIVLTSNVVVFSVYFFEYMTKMSHEIFEEEVTFDKRLNKIGETIRDVKWEE